MVQYIYDYGTENGPDYDTDYDVDGIMYNLAFGYRQANGWTYSVNLAVGCDINMEGEDPVGRDLDAEMQRYDLDLFMTIPWKSLNDNWFAFGVQVGAKIAWIEKEFSISGVDDWEQTNIWAGPFIGWYAIVPLGSKGSWLHDIRLFGTANLMGLMAYQNEQGRSVAGDVEFSTIGTGINATIGASWRVTSWFYIEGGYKGQYLTTGRENNFDMYHSSFGQLKFAW